MTPLHGVGSSVPDIGRPMIAGDIPTLIHHLNNADPTVRWQAAEALGTCGEKAVPLLIMALQSPPVPLRLGAIEALGTIRDLHAVRPPTFSGVLHIL